MKPLARALLCCALFAAAAVQGQAGELRPFTSGSWKDVTSASSGKPTIVHFWGLSCGICIAELPEWGAFAAKHPDARLVLINWDRRPQDVKRISETLAKNKLAGVENWVLADDFEDKARFTVDRTWIGELPRTRLIAANGKTTGLSGTTNFHELGAWLRRQDGGNDGTSPTSP